MTHEEHEEDEGPITSPGGRVTNEDLLFEFREREERREREDAERWKKHDSEANERNAALMTAVLGDRERVNAIDNRVRHLETVGVPASTRRWVVVMAIIFAFAVAAIYLDLGLRFFIFEHAPVVRAVVIP